MSNLRYGYVACHYFANFYVDSRMVSCHTLNLGNGLCSVDNFFSNADKIYVVCQFEEMSVLPGQIQGSRAINVWKDGTEVVYCGGRGGAAIVI